jgi:hypothetical protein
MGEVMAGLSMVARELGDIEAVFDGIAVLQRFGLNLRWFQRLRDFERFEKASCLDCPL